MRLGLVIEKSQTFVRSPERVEQHSILQEASVLVEVVNDNF